MERNQLLSILKEQLQRGKHEAELCARKVRETEHSVVKLVYAELMRDSIHHAEALSRPMAYAYQARSKWEFAPIHEDRSEILRAMDVEERALRLFASASMQVVDPHLKSLLTMLALDEEQHYAMLRYILENFVKKEEINAS
jgi:rubrerythrin